MEKVSVKREQGQNFMEELDSLELTLEGWSH